MESMKKGEAGRRVNRPSWDETNKKEEEEALEELRVWFAGPK